MMATLQEAEARLQELGPIPFPLPLGSLAPIVEGGFRGMMKGDWIVPGPRERVGAVLRGCPPERLVHAHAGARPYKVAPASSAPGTRALHAVGLALASGAPVLCFLGLASAATGSFAEALNVAALTQAPVIFLVAVQPIDDTAPVGRQLAASPKALAAAYGIPAASVAGGDADAIAAAVQKARGKLTLIEVALSR
jgi:2-oxoisovalerate dehydrogenase E1 component alpha subunit